MKKILAPLVGLTTVATVAAPLATSCTSEASVNHIKSSPVEEVTPKNGIAQYVLVLDRNDYDVNGFKVVVKVADNDKTGAKSQEFKASWIVDGDHLIVDVEYLLKEEEAPEEDCTVKLNLVVNYGSEWKETVAVKFAYVALKGLPMEWKTDYSRNRFEYYLGIITKGQDYTFIVDLSQMPSSYSMPNYFGYDHTGTPCAWFEKYAFQIDGKVVPESYYNVYTDEGDSCDYVWFNKSFIEELKSNSKITIQCINALQNSSEMYIQMYYWS